MSEANFNRQISKFSFGMVKLFLKNWKLSIGESDLSLPNLAVGAYYLQMNVN